ncbi:MAG: alpha/beta fold hydrolase [Acidimicrobiales bacterium]
MSELKIHYDIAGEGSPVVFTAGWRNLGEVWAPTVSSLGGTVRSVTWDLRGHGRSDAAPPGQYGRDYALADLDRMIDIAGSPAVLVGHSLGGYLSLAEAILSPERVAGLVLVAAGPGFRSRDSLDQWNESVRAMAEKADDVPEGMEEISMHVDSLVIDRLGEIGVPAIVIVGERDKRFLASADVFAKHLDVRDRIVVPDAGHMVHAKHGNVVADAVRSMLATLNPPS